MPKRQVSADGTAGEPNHIALAGLNHKMGQRGTTNCVLNFGEDGECLGQLIGEPHRGMDYMFHMMNEARIGVGHAATTAGLGGYLYSADYARTRTQGRLAGRKDPLSPQVPIIEHADVRRMLLAQKAAVEGAQALCLYCAMLVDEIALATDEQQATAERWRCCTTEQDSAAGLKSGVWLKPTERRHRCRATISKIFTHSLAFFRRSGRRAVRGQCLRKFSRLFLPPSGTYQYEVSIPVLERFPHSVPETSAVFLYRPPP